MAQFKVFRETALPTSLQPYSIYYVAPASKPNYVEIYVSDATGSSARRVLNDNDIQGMIDASIANLSAIEVVDSISDRDDLFVGNNSQQANKLVLVIDATGDPTVSSGSATYLWRVLQDSPPLGEWIKIAEYESMDLVLSWANLQGKPNSSPSDIDDAVAKRHTHANKTELDKIGEDANGFFTYNGNFPVIAWDSVSW